MLISNLSISFVSFLTDDDNSLGYNGAITPGTQYELFTSTETNITTGETETDSYTHGINYSIAYDGKYPTEIMETEQGDSFTITTYYEYE